MSAHAASAATLMQATCTPRSPTRCMSAMACPRMDPSAKPNSRLGAQMRSAKGTFFTLSVTAANSSLSTSTELQRYKHQHSTKGSSAVTTALSGLSRSRFDTRANTTMPTTSDSAVDVTMVAMSHCPNDTPKLMSSTAEPMPVAAPPAMMAAKPSDVSTSAAHTSRVPPAARNAPMKRLSARRCGVNSRRRSMREQVPYVNSDRTRNTSEAR